MSKKYEKIIARERSKSETFRRIDDLRVDLNKYFIENYGGKRPPCDIPFNNTLDFQRAAFRLYLRYYEAKQYEGMLLVIANYEFNKPGDNQMTGCWGQKPRPQHLEKFIHFVVKTCFCTKSGV